jgi:hypothetical protein
MPWNPASRLTSEPEGEYRGDQYERDHKEVLREQTDGWL